MVTPYIAWADSMVFLEWVMTMNWVSVGHLAQQSREPADVGFVERRVHFVEHAERAGLIFEDRHQQASAVSAFSPPESSRTFCSFLPGARR